MDKISIGVCSSKKSLYQQGAIAASSSRSQKFLNIQNAEAVISVFWYSNGLFVSWNFGFAEGPLPDDPFYQLEFGTRYRFSDRLSMEVEYSRNYDNGQFGYAFLRDGATGAPILARRKYADVTTLFSGIYNFTPRMNLIFRARHFWYRLLNTNLYDVVPAGDWIRPAGRVVSRHAKTG